VNVRTYKGNGEALCETVVAIKAIIITYAECVSVAFIIQRAKRMRRIILSSVACLGLPYSSTSSHKRNDFRNKSY
jgi:hypothetical protein